MTHPESDGAAAEAPAAEATDGQPAGPPPLRSVHTSNFAAILGHFGCSLLVTTYQAGKLVVVRPDADNPDLINTHFRTFNKPMGLALGNQRLGLGRHRKSFSFETCLRPPGGWNQRESMTPVSCRGVCT